MLKDATDAKQSDLAAAARRQTVPRPSVMGAAVIAISLAVFGVALGGGFLWDDHPLIENNAYVHSFAYAERWLRTELWDVSGPSASAFSISYYRPLAALSFASDWVLGQGSPTVFHATNLLLHATVAALAFIALRRWLGDDTRAFIATLVFALHPTKAESVAWISSRTDMLVMCGLLLVSLGAARRFRGNMRLGVPIETAGTLIAYASKEIAVLAPFFVAVEAWAATGRGSLTRPTLRAMARASAPQLTVALGYTVVRALWLPIDHRYSIEASVWVRILRVAESLGRYFHLALVPFPLSVQQGLTRVSPQGAVQVNLVYVAVGVAGLVGLAAVLLRTARRTPAVAVGAGLFVASLVPFVNIVPTTMSTLVSERFMYVATLGMAMVVGAVLARAVASRWRVGVLGVALGVFGPLSAVRSAQFEDETSFWARELRLQPDSPEAAVQLGRIELRRGNTVRALELWTDAHWRTKAGWSYLGFSPGFGMEAIALIVGATLDSRTQRLHQLDAYLEALSGTGPSPVVLQVDRFRYSMPRVNEPGIVFPPSAVLILYNLRASIASRLGEDERALALVHTRLALCPNCARGSDDAALVLARAGRFDEAQQVVVHSRSPADPALQINLARIASARDAWLAAQQLEGPGKDIGLATVQSRLYAWGRAYRLMEPSAGSFSGAPDVELRFAEIAWLAGYTQRAVPLMTRLLGPEAGARRARELSDDMGWSELDHAGAPDVFEYPAFATPPRE